MADNPQDDSSSDGWSDALIDKMDTDGVPFQVGVCVHCVHKHPGKNSCDAYPAGGIPLEIANGNNDHTQPFKGDHGIRYEGWDEI